MEKGLYKGKFTTTRNASETDAFFEIMSTLMKVLDYEKGKEMDLDYIVNTKNRFLMIMDDIEVLISCKMIKCEKVLYEPMANKDSIMKAYNIAEAEWSKMIAFYPELDTREPIKRVYDYEMELTVSKPEYEEYLEIAVNLLKEIN